DIVFELLYHYTYEHADLPRNIQETLERGKFNTLVLLIGELQDSRTGICISDGKAMQEWMALEQAYLVAALSGVNATRERAANTGNGHSSYRAVFLDEAVNTVIAGDMFLRAAALRGMYLPDHGPRTEEVFTQELRARLTMLGHELMERADVRLLGDRYSAITAPVVLFIEHLPTPVEFDGYRKFFGKFLKAVVGTAGSPSSHYALAAKTHNIPVFIMDEGDREAVLLLRGGAEVLVSDRVGIVIRPDEAKKGALAEEDARRNAHRARMGVFAGQSEAVAYANADLPELIRQALTDGAEGIGLVRVENLFNTLLTLSFDDFMKIFGNILDAADDKALTVRMIDIQKDKQPDSLAHVAYGGSLCYLEHSMVREIAITLLRVWFRLARERQRKNPKARKLRIMFPMFRTADDALATRAIVREAGRQERILDFDPLVTFGIMVETPEAAMNIAMIYKAWPQLRFFSFGTNDFIKFLFQDEGASRSNTEQYIKYFTQKKARLLRAVSAVQVFAGKNGIDLSMCGDLASQRQFWVILALGNKEAAAIIPSIPSPLIREYQAWQWYIACGKDKTLAARLTGVVALLDRVVGSNKDTEDALDEALDLALTEITAHITAQLSGLSLPSEAGRPDPACTVSGLELSPEDAAVAFHHYFHYLNLAHDGKLERFTLAEDMASIDRRLRAAGLDGMADAFHVAVTSGRIVWGPEEFFQKMAERGLALYAYNVSGYAHLAPILWDMSSAARQEAIVHEFCAMSGMTHEDSKVAGKIMKDGVSPEHIAGVRAAWLDAPQRILRRYGDLLSDDPATADEAAGHRTLRERALLVVTGKAEGFPMAKALREFLLREYAAHPEYILLKVPSDAKKKKKKLLVAYYGAMDMASFPEARVMPDEAWQILAQALMINIVPFAGKEGEEGVTRSQWRAETAVRVLNAGVFRGDLPELQSLILSRSIDLLAQFSRMKNRRRYDELWYGLFPILDRAFRREGFFQVLFNVFHEKYIRREAEPAPYAQALEIVAALPRAMPEFRMKFIRALYAWGQKTGFDVGNIVREIYQPASYTGILPRIEAAHPEWEGVRPAVDTAFVRYNHFSARWEVLAFMHEKRLWGLPGKLIRTATDGWTDADWLSMAKQAAQERFGISPEHGLWQGVVFCGEETVPDPRGPVKTHLYCLPLSMQESKALEFSKGRLAMTVAWVDAS
ncbi:MAG: hypothetical protein HQL19_08330, partial [Candidatus Omnitrophica bacterium]|nr:hypothetical protein [Candidatus Omnitrophota bacterium]